MRSLTTALIVCVLASAGPARAHQYLDYFGYGASELSPLGYRTAASVAEYVRIYSQRWGPDYRIVVSAHMDSAEAAEFSDELSAQRAQSMANELVRLGLDAQRIEMRGYGATQLARPTDVGVREPLNRRVLVDVNFHTIPPR